jgi:hypothetical protein
MRSAPTVAVALAALAFAAWMAWQGLRPTRLYADAPPSIVPGVEQAVSPAAAGARRLPHQLRLYTKE